MTPRTRKATRKLIRALRDIGAAVKTYPAFGLRAKDRAGSITRVNGEYVTVLLGRRGNYLSAGYANTAYLPANAHASELARRLVLMAANQKDARDSWVESILGRREKARQAKLAAAK